MDKELKEELEQIKSLVKNIEDKIEALKLEKRDKFFELKEAHRNGALIQFRNEHTGNKWVDCWDNMPAWVSTIEYRVKPEDKFAELKKAYRNGAEIQFKSKLDDGWHDIDVNEPHWDTSYEYRIKPEDKFADIKEAYKNGAVIEFFNILTKKWTVLKGEPLWISDFKYRIKPEERPKIGDICKFWENDEDNYCVCVLVKDGKSDFPYKTNQGIWYKNAKKLTKEEAIELLFGKEENND